jgi:hypothetical protein
MPLFARMIAVTLLLAMTASALAAAVFETPRQSPLPAAPCHQHQPSTPSAPVGYQCCIGGHHAAILQSSISQPPESIDGRRVAVEGSPSIPQMTQDFLPAMIHASGSPPRDFTLRI